MSTWEKRAGFTLIELLITVAIVALLASAALPVGELAVKRSKEQELRAALRQIREALDTYKELVGSGRIASAADESGYPRTLEVLVEGVPDAKSPDKRRIYILRRLPRNPLWPDPAAAPAATWGKRSYESSHDNPQPGRDVFDVYPNSDEVGLNGIAYREW